MPLSSTLFPQVHGRKGEQMDAHRRITSAPKRPVCPGGRHRAALRACIGILAGLAALRGDPHAVLAQAQTDPVTLLQEADRLAWMKAWTKAAPLFMQAQHLFEARG